MDNTGIINIFSSKTSFFDTFLFSYLNNTKNQLLRCQQVDSMFGAADVYFADEE